MAVKTVVMVIVFISLAIATTAVLVDSFGYLESTDTCNNCHSMQLYVESLVSPINGSVISSHSNIACIDCHGGTTYKHRLDAQLTIAKKIGSYGLISNISGVDTTALDVNCIDCHSTIGDSIAHSGKSSCDECHLAHRDTLLPQEFNELDCSKCHKLPEMAGGHAPMDCRSCHIRHKYKPNCTQCHPPHVKAGTSDEDLAAIISDWTNDVCLDCHNDYHSPSKELVFSLSPDMDKELCAECHREYTMLKTYGSFHNKLQSCANCHISHGEIDVRGCSTPYCHGRIRYDDADLYKDPGDMDAYSRHSMCAICHGSGPMELHFNAPEHKDCRNCHGLSHQTVHSDYKSCSDCHDLGRKCTDCHEANIHKLKA